LRLFLLLGDPQWRLKPASPSFELIDKTDSRGPPGKTSKPIVNSERRYQFGLEIELGAEDRKLQPLKKALQRINIAVRKKKK